MSRSFQPSLRDLGASELTPNVETLGFYRDIPPGMEMKILVALDIPLRSGVRTLQIHYCFSRVFPNRILLRTGMSRSDRLGLRGLAELLRRHLLLFCFGSFGERSAARRQASATLSNS